MLRSIAAGLLIHIERRGLIEVFPEAARKLWKKWQLRTLVVFSLILQILLILLGNRRKCSGRLWLRLTVWSAYLLADWVATVALGVISNNIQAEPNNKAPSEVDLISFWAPFLLLHLGGPDTITAYSVEDNQLWQRRLIELVTQTLVSLYIFLIAWPGISSLSLLTIPMLIAGSIKFAERICSLRSASMEHIRDSLLTDPDPGPNYAKFMEDFTLKKAEGFYVKADEMIEAPIPSSFSDPVHDDAFILKAYDFFQTFKRLFVDLILSFQDRENSQSFFHGLKSEKAFRVVEMELGFAYDAFYTKATIIFTPRGCILRLISFSATLISLMVFILISRGNHYHRTDLIITYLLLLVAIFLEIYALLVLLFSDRTQCWLRTQDRNSYKYRLSKRFHPSTKRWSNMMAQYSLLSVCLKKKPPILPKIQRLLTADKVLEKHRYLTYSEVSNDLKEMIFQYFLGICRNSTNNAEPTAVCTSRGTLALKKNDCGELDWSTRTVEFDQSILLWHIATELCYYSDGNAVSAATSTQRKESKHMSDYMLYLLAMCPFMLPIGIGMIRFQDTCAEAEEFLKERGEKADKAKVCRMLLRVNTEVPPARVKGDRSKSLLFDACRLASVLRAKGPMAQWEIISQVWVEIMAYAASHCRGTQHAQQLRKGGELLTHVWLLMAHLGITEQFQISQGHARAKLSAK